MLDKLREQGWHLSSEGYKKCVEATGQKEPSLSKLTSSALTMDLRHIGDKFLPDNINSGNIVWELLFFCFFINIS